MEDVDLEYQRKLASIFGKDYIGQFWDKEDIFSGFNNTVLRITSAEYFPFSTKVERPDGTIYYTGVCAHMIEVLANVLQFRYEWQESKDGQFGAVDENLQWVGMVGEIVRGEADIAASGITISAQRDTVVDFTYPFYEEELGVAVKEVLDDKYISVIFRPFETYLWLLLCLAVVLVGITLSLVGQITGKIHREKDPLSTFIKGIWYCLGTFLTQSQIEHARFSSVRVIAGAWMLFCLVMYAVYTANLVVFLAVHEYKLPFETLEEMVAQDEISYGVQVGSVGMLVFHTATRGIYTDLYTGITSKSDNMVILNSNGIRKVSEENYAFISDVTILETEIGENCQISLIKERFYKTGFGLAVPEGWKYKKYFDRVILTLTEHGFVEYWKQKELSKTRRECIGGVHVQASTITLRDTTGPFLILLCGVILATIVLAIEIYLHNLKDSLITTISLFGYTADDYHVRRHRRVKRR